MTSSDGLSPEQLARVLEVGRRLVSNLELEPLLREILEAAAELTGARYAALGILDAERSGLERFLYRGIDEETRRRIGPLPRGRGLLGELIRRPETLRLARIADHPRSFGFPAGHPTMTSFLGCPVKVRGEVFGNIYLTDKASAPEFDAADAELLEVLAEWAAIAIDNARTHERSEARRVELERAVEGLEATVELSRAVDGETDLGWVLELIAKRARALAGARACALLLGSGAQLELAAHAGAPSGAHAGARLRASAPTLEALRAGVAQRLEGREAAGLLDLGFEPAAALLAPLRTGGRTIGALVVLDRATASGPFDAEDELVVSSFAAGAAGLIAAVRAHADEKLRLAIAASEQERRRWARELHDETLQELGALRLAQHAALAVDDPAAMRAAVERATDQVERVIAGLEEVIHDLRPAALDQLGVAAALEALIERVEGRFGIEVEADLALPGDGSAPERLAPELEATLYRVVQEALTNVGKHAGASRARVAIDVRDGAVVATVEDDGTGIDPARRGQGFGLIGMRERVALLGGELKVGPGAGGGTRVVATLPLRGAGAQRSTSPFSSA